MSVYVVARLLIGKRLVHDHEEAKRKPQAYLTRTCRLSMQFLRTTRAPCLALLLAACLLAGWPYLPAWLAQSAAPPQPS